MRDETLQWEPGTPIGVGLVGYGFAGRGFHAYLVDQEPLLHLRGVYVPSNERRVQAAQDRPVVVYPHYEALLKSDEIDLVILATPHDIHATQAIQAMEAGKHVVVDKIICMNAEEARQMANASERNGVVLSVFHNRRWDGDYLTIRDAWHSGLLGEVYAAECCVMSYGSPGGWRARKEKCGGVLYDWGAHLVDQAIQICGRPEAVTGWIVDRGVWPTADIGNYGRIVIGFENGVLYTIETGNLARIPKPHWHLLGTKGSLRKEGVDPQEAAMLAGDITRAHEDPALAASVRTEVEGQTVDMKLESRPGDWREYYRNVALAIQGLAPLAVTPPQMITLMEVFDAAMESARTGQTVQVRC